MALVRSALPIFNYEKELIAHIEEALSVSIVIGETGSGKTTQLPQLLLKHGFAQEKQIVVSQPRRVGAMSVASRVAEEMECALGDKVGYTVRFEDCTNQRTRIKYVTDGCLLKDFLKKDGLNRYNVIILDEAHERSLHTDILFGLVKQRFVIPSYEEKRRIGPRIIVMSATLDVSKFSSFFDAAPYHIPGSLFPVHRKYCNVISEDDFQNCVSSFGSKAVEKAMEIHKQEDSGDILVFLTGQAEIEKACDSIFHAGEKLNYRYDVLDKEVVGLMVLPLYSSLPVEAQKKVFAPAPSGIRKIIFSTNVAATSVTIDGIKYVVDSGFVKQSTYNHSTGLQSLAVVPISKSEAKQRAGRAGRTSSGMVFRLYSKRSFKEQMPESTVPEIQRTSLTSVVLFLKCSGIADVLQFNYIDAPSQTTMLEALRTLIVLGAISPETGEPTEIGKQMSEYPVNPEYSIAIIQAIELGCLQEIITVIALLSTDRLFYRPTKDQQMEIYNSREEELERFKEENAVIDDATSLIIFFEQCWAQKSTRQWCQKMAINMRSMNSGRNIGRQLMDILGKQGLSISSCRSERHQREGILTVRASELVRKCLSFGFFGQCARIVANRTFFRTMEGNGNIVFIQPGSILFQKEDNIDWCLYLNLTFTSKPFMQNVIIIQYDWVKNLIPRLHEFDLEMITSTGAIDSSGKRKNSRLVFAGSNVLQKDNEKNSVEDSMTHKRKTSDNAVELARKRFMKRKQKK